MAELQYHEEEALGRAYDARLMRRLLGFLRPYRGQVVVATLLVLAAAALELVGPWLVKIAIDQHISRDDLTGLGWIAMAYLGVLAIELAVGYFQMSIMQTVGQKIMYDLRLAIFTKLQLAEEPGLHRRVAAVVAYLRAAG